MGELRLTPLLSDGMILQRDRENCIWGYADAGETIRLQMGAYQTGTQAKADGYFKLYLPPMQAGGPWEIIVSDGEEEIVIRDVLFGDVFLLGGQSNMELPVARTMERYEQEILETCEPQIRYFEVPKEYDFLQKREMLSGGKWMRAAGEELLNFSAVGYFAAKELYDKKKVPIGLVQTAVGGTPVKAWSSEDTILHLHHDVEELRQCKREGYPEEVIAQEAEREKDWWEQALLPFEGQLDETLMKKITLPGFFEQDGLEDFCGSILLKKKVVLKASDEWETERLRLYFGAVIDADSIYVNGVKIGETTYKYPPRIYPIPKGVLKDGENEIEVRMLIFRRKGGFMPGKQYAITCGTEEVASLEGDWEYKIVQKMNELPETTFFEYKASGLYNGMIHPLRRCQFKGCFFYQGESNTGRPETYEEEFSAMMSDWRDLLKQPTLPFIFVQLAGFADGAGQTAGVEWAKLREAQRLAQRAGNARMVQAYDLGEYNDLHPTDKKNVGKRVALATEKLIYGQDVACTGPELSKAVWNSQSVELYFATEGADTKLIVKGATKQVQGFSVVAEDMTVHQAEAFLSGNDCVTVFYPRLVNVRKVCFAWNDCPLDANLYDINGLPVVPFCCCRK